METVERQDYRMWTSNVHEGSRDQSCGGRGGGQEPGSIVGVSHPGVATASSPDKSHCVVASVLSHNLTMALPRAPWPRHTGTQGLACPAWITEAGHQAADSGPRAGWLQTLGIHSSVW